MVFTDRVKDITYNEILPSIVDFVNNSNIFTARVTSNPKNWKGVTIDQPIRIANSNTGGSFDGLDQFDTSATNNTRSMKWYVKAYEQSVVVPGIEKAVNGNSEKQVLSLVSDRMDEAMISLADAIGTLLYGYGTGKDIEGLGLIVDDGTATSSYAGLSRADIPALNGDVTAAASGQLTLDTVSGSFDNVSAAGAGREAPTIAITTKAVWSLFESLLHKDGILQAKYDATSISGYNRVSGKTPKGTSVPAQALKGAFGVDAISYRGKPVVADDKCPDGDFYWLNENYIEFRRLLSPDLTSVSTKPKVTEGAYSDNSDQVPSFLQMRDFLSPVNQFGEIGALIVMGNLICRQPRRNAVITGITTIA